MNTIACAPALLRSTLLLIDLLAAKHQAMPVISHINERRPLHQAAAPFLPSRRLGTGRTDQPGIISAFRHDEMCNPIVPIAKIRAAAEETVRSGKTVHDCPSEFNFAEVVWKGEYWFAHYEYIYCKPSN